MKSTQIVNIELTELKIKLQVFYEIIFTPLLLSSCYWYWFLVKETETQRPLAHLSNKELAVELIEATTDIEKRLFKTFKDLLFIPEKVFFDYIGLRKEGYFSVFRYFILSIFISYLGFSFFFQPGAIGGPYYTSLLNGIESSYSHRAKPDVRLTINKEKYDVFYLEFSRLMVLTYKLFSCFNIPAIFLAMLLFFRKLKLNFASLLVVSVFLSSQTAIISSALLFPLNFIIKDSLALSLILYIPIIMFFIYCFYRLSIGHYKRPLLRSCLAATTSGLIFSALNMGFGSALSIYVHSYTPSYVEKVYTIPDVSPDPALKTE